MKIVIKYKKLGKEKVHGLAYEDGEVVIDSRLKGRKHLEILIHEVSHLLWAEADEATIVEKSITLTRILWKEGYRRVDNSKHLPLQDGSK